jgi:hypothetical protein
LRGSSRHHHSADQPGSTYEVRSRMFSSQPSFTLDPSFPCYCMGCGDLAPIEGFEFAAYQVRVCKRCRCIAYGVPCLPTLILLDLGLAGDANMDGLGVLNFGTKRTLATHQPSRLIVSEARSCDEMAGAAADSLTRTVQVGTLQTTPRGTTGCSTFFFNNARTNRRLEYTIVIQIEVWLRVP